MKAEVLIDAQCNLAEGIQWNGRQQRLWWTDIHGKALWSCDADGANADKIACAERLGAFAFDPDDNLLCAFESGLFRWNLEKDRLERLTDFEPEHPTSRLNDGRCDRHGRFVVGGMDEDGLKRTSSVIRFDGAVETFRREVGVTNSLCFSPDGAWMYFADTPSGVIERYPYADGEVGEPEPFFALTGAGNGWPDGSCVDAEGALWNARWDGYKVQRITPDGEAAEAVEVGAPKVSCACFGGPDLDRLYITTAQEGMSVEDLEKEPLSGAIFVAEPGVKGLPEDRYATRLFA